MYLFSYLDFSIIGKIVLLVVAFKMIVFSFKIHKEKEENSSASRELGIRLGKEFLLSSSEHI